jgi:hypothetical protein
LLSQQVSLGTVEVLEAQMGAQLVQVKESAAQELAHTVAQKDAVIVSLQTR